MYKNFLLPTVFIFLFFSSFAQKEFKNQSVSIFKNGTAFFIKSGEVETENRSYTFQKDMPEALFGTLWFNSPDNSLKSVQSSKDTIFETKEVQNLVEKLKANIGKVVSVTYFTPGAEMSLANTSSGIIKHVAFDFVEIKGRTRWISIKTANILKISFEEFPGNHWNQEKLKQVIRVKFDSEKKKQPIEMMYLQQKLAWLPNYLVSLKDEKTAFLTLRATVMNDAEDIENTDINFVVGVPNFRFSSLGSPLMNTMPVLDFLSKLNRTVDGNQNQNYYQGLSNMMTAQIAFSPETYEEQIVMVPAGEDPMQLEGSAEEDLFFYKMENVSLIKGDRAFFDILKTEIPIEHIYKVNLRANDNNTYYASSKDEMEEERNVVLHTIKIFNEGNTPWTTGTAMVLNSTEGLPKPLSQDILKYTASKGDSYLTITASPNIKVTQTEIETSREDKVKRWSGTYYDLVKVESKVKIKNFKEKSIKMELKRKITGRLVSSDIPWDFSHQIRQQNSVNQVNNVKWELELKAGEEHELKYDYELYVRHY